MLLIERVKSVKTKYLILVFIILGLYTAAHFFYSGVYFPVKHRDKIAQMQEEVTPLANLFQGKTSKFVSENPRQYGPFFILIITPFMVFYNNQNVFAMAILFFEYLIVALALFLSCKYLFKFQDHKEKVIICSAIVLLWLNFSPLLYIITVSNVETWELLLIILGFMMYIKRRFFWTGFFFAAATLIKMLPAIFIFYFLFKNRKVFFYCLLNLFIIMFLAGLIFGNNIGLLYLPFLVTRPLGSGTWASAFFENISLKGFIYKLSAGFKANAWGYAFNLTPNAEQTAYIIITVLQLILLACIVWMALRKMNSEEGLMIEFSLVSLGMLIISPLAAYEYATLLLFAYSVGIYFIFKYHISWWACLLYGISYVLVGNFIPLSMLLKFIPIQAINTYFGNTKFDPAESYKAYCFPLLGFILLTIFFISLLKNKEYSLKN